MNAKLRKLIRGHLSIGPVTIYGRNAMHWAVDIRTRRGTLCLRPTTWTFGVRWPWYLYLSPNATPWAATFAIGPGVAVAEKLLSPVRRALFGFRYDTDLLTTYQPYLEIKRDALAAAREHEHGFFGGLRRANCPS